MPDQIELIVLIVILNYLPVSVELNVVVKLIVICLTCQGLVVTSL